jgi:hypothetical protein
MSRHMTVSSTPHGHAATSKGATSQADDFSHDKWLAAHAPCTGSVDPRGAMVAAIAANAPGPLVGHGHGHGHGPGHGSTRSDVRDAMIAANHGPAKVHTANAVSAPAPSQRSIFGADGHVTPHPNPDLISIFQGAVQENTEWSRRRMGPPPGPQSAAAFAEPGAAGRTPVTPENEQVIRSQLLQNHDADLQALPVEQMVIADLIDRTGQFTLMNEFLGRALDEATASVGAPEPNVDRLRFVRQSEELARGTMNDIIRAFTARVAGS